MRLGPRVARLVSMRMDEVPAGSGSAPLLTAADEVDLPVLGICRGMQLMAVHAGGTLDQHTPDLVGNDAHSPGGDAYGDVEVETAPGSRLASLVGAHVEVGCRRRELAGAPHHLDAGILTRGTVSLDVHRDPEGPQHAHHRLGVVGDERPVEVARARRERGAHERSVGDRLRSGDHGRGVERARGRLHRVGVGERAEVEGCGHRSDDTVGR